MYRAAFAYVTVAALAFAPKSCTKPNNRPPEADLPLPPPVPITSATTPPIWAPPEPVGQPASPTPPNAPPPSAELVKARAAADAKDFKKVRTLLEKKVRGGKCAPEEAQLVFRACVQLKDKACVEGVRAKHPDDVSAIDDPLSKF